VAAVAVMMITAVVDVATVAAATIEMKWTERSDWQ
jgi:hypothetical protein